MKYTVFIALSILSSCLFGQSKLAGSWDTGEDNTIIEISEVDGKLRGTIKSSDNPKAKMGHIILKKLNKNGKAWKGEIYAVKRQDWYDVYITQKGDVLQIDLSIGLLRKTIYWKRI